MIEKRKIDKKMSVKTKLAGLGILAAGFMASGHNPQAAQELKLKYKTAMAHFSAQKDNNTEREAEEERTTSKREPEKIYHRFEEIPEISDDEAYLYDRDEYAYIINADKYQKSGEIELKRVLKAELTQASALNLVYRSECETRDSLDKVARYDINLRLLNKSGKYKGPTQMDDNTVSSFIKYLAANPESRKKVLPLLQGAAGSTSSAAQKLETVFFDEKGDMRTMAERNNAIHSDAFKNIKLKVGAWKTVASPELKKFINQNEAGRKSPLSNATKSYLVLTSLFSKEELKRHLEDFNLGFYQLGRSGQTKTVIAELATKMNLKDSGGNPDGTRVPIVAIAAAISNINWKGNGNGPAGSVSRFSCSSSSFEEKKKKLCKTVKNWVSGKSRNYGVDEMAQLNILTPDIIRQYTELELPGAKRLRDEYLKAVIKAERRQTLAATRKKKSLQSETQQDTPLTQAKTYNIPFIAAQEKLNSRN